MASEVNIPSQFEAFACHGTAAFANHHAANSMAFEPQLPEPMQGTAAIGKDVGD